MGLMKENLNKMSIEQLRGKLAEVKSEFKRTAAEAYTPERQEQILKGKAIKGNTKKQKQTLVSQINKISAAISKVSSINFTNDYHADTQFAKDVEKALKKVEQRRMELLKNGIYETHLNAKEKVYYWCDCMNFSRSDLRVLLSVYTFEELAEMSGDEFYDEMLDVKLSYKLGEDTVLEEQVDEEAIRAATRDRLEHTSDIIELTKKAAQEAEEKGYEGQEAWKYIEKRIKTLKKQEENKDVRAAKNAVKKEYRESFKDELGQNIRKQEFAKPVDKRIAELDRLKEKRKRRKAIDLTTLL